MFSGFEAFISNVFNTEKNYDAGSDSEEFTEDLFMLRNDLKLSEEQKSNREWVLEMLSVYNKLRFQKNQINSCEPEPDFGPLVFVLGQCDHYPFSRRIIEILNSGQPDLLLHPMIQAWRTWAGLTDKELSVLLEDFTESSGLETGRHSLSMKYETLMKESSSREFGFRLNSKNHFIENFKPKSRKPETGNFDKDGNFSLIIVPNGIGEKLYAIKFTKSF